MGERVERAHRHLRAEVAAADADVDDVASDAARPSARSRTVSAKASIASSTAWTSSLNGALPARRAQRGVQHRAAFGVVDRRAGEHRVAVRLDAAFARQVGEEAQRRRVDEVLRQVGEDLGRLERHRVEAARIAGERLAQVEVAAVRLVVAARARPRPAAVAAAWRRRIRRDGWIIAPLSDRTSWMA